MPRWRAQPDEKMQRQLGLEPWAHHVGKHLRDKAAQRRLRFNIPPASGRRLVSIKAQLCTGSDKTNPTGPTMRMSLNTLRMVSRKAKRVGRKACRKYCEREGGKKAAGMRNRR